MVDYDSFLEALEAPFEDFVKNDDVNTYLQTIGGEVTTEILEDGILSEFTIVSGYEPERGNWATIYSHQLRIGHEIIPVEELNSSLVVSPNLFYGKNHKGEEVEYRLGLVRDRSKIRVQPVILKRGRDGRIKVRVLQDLCVIHRGIHIDPETARQSGKSVAEMTSYQQFLTCFWNLDDYLRKQNPNFHSDFDVEIWQAVEVFSGRIIDQMLRRIVDHFMNRESRLYWVIPEAEAVYRKGLLSWIERCITEEGEISASQTIYLVKNLCSYMNRFRNYQPLEELQEKGLNILPYILENFNSTESEVQGEALRAFNMAVKKINSFDPSVVVKVLELLPNESPNLIETFELIIKKDPALIDLSIAQIQKMFSSPDKATCTAALRLYAKIILNSSESTEQNVFNQIIPILFDPKPEVRDAAFNVFKIALDRAPQFIPQALDQIIERFLDKDRTIRKSALEAYEATLINQSNIIPQILAKVLSLFLNTEEHARMSALKAYLKTLQHCPQLIDQSGVDNVLNLLSDPLWDIKIIALKAIALLIEKTPQFIPETLPKIIDLCINDSDWDMQLITLKIYTLILENIPEIIEDQMFSQILEFFSSTNQHVRSTAIESYTAAIKAAPKLINADAIDQIFNLISDDLPDIREKALESCTAAISRVTYLIIQHHVNRILPLLADPHTLVRRSALQAYQQVILKCPAFVTQEGIDTVFELLSDRFWEVRMSALEIFETALRKVPQFTTNSIEQLMELFFTQHYDLKIITLKALDTAFSTMPQAFNQRTITRIFTLLGDENKFVREAALGTLRIAIARVPQLITKELLQKIESMQSDEDMLVQLAAKKARQTARIKVPHFFATRS